jgi:hypothetical protein
MWHGEIQLLQMLAMWKISKVKIHSTHRCDQIAFIADLYPILRATADKISLKPLTQFWINGSHERVSCFHSVTHLNKKILRKRWNNIAEILLLWVWMCEVTLRFFVPFFKLWYLSWSLTAECCKGLSYAPEVQCVPSSCRLMLQRAKLHVRSITSKELCDHKCTFFFMWRISYIVRL